MSDNEIIRNAIALVNEGMRVTFPVKGNSMLPFIIGSRESVDLVKPESPKVGDVVLAWVEGCRYVVHRIISIDGDRVTLMGDGNIAGVEHCRLGDVAALAINVVTPGGKHKPLYSPWRVRASRLWWRLLPVRRWILAVYRRTYLKLKYAAK
ncbi:MAG: S24/S26 family peptidase [Prevotella sp.]|nr:S24/S26 family peptidase [Prevotella sp.]